MSTISAAPETQVAAIRAMGPRPSQRSGSPPTLRQRLVLDRQYRALLDLLAPRIRHFTRQYGLTDMADDAHQACATAIHRAVGEYDPAKARFTTFVNWKIRGELQSLRHKMRLDQRGSAQRIGARTLSLDMLTGDAGDSSQGSGAAAFTVVDDEALARVEAGASERMARRFADLLLDDYLEQFRQRRSQRPARSLAKEHAVKPGTRSPMELPGLEATLERECIIVSNHLAGNADEGKDDALTSEQKRQITRRMLRNLGKHMQTQPRFAAALSTVH